MSRSPALDDSGDVAVIGMACRFPGARDVAQFWDNLRRGVESVSFLSDEQRSALGDEAAGPRYVGAYSHLEGWDLFDAGLFGLSPREALVMDPQQRLFLECGWQALEHAAHDGARTGAVGVFAGVTASRWARRLDANPGVAAAVGEMQLVIGNDKDHLAPRLSYLLDLRGPSVPVQTACSTSLVAVHLACQSLLQYESDLALAGGCTIAGFEPGGYLYQEEGLMSADGHCRAFDAAAGGTAPGSGVGVVVLRRLADAVADGDHVHAVIKGSAINNDGASKVGYTAPSVEGQRRVLREAMAVAGVEAAEISCVEAHGTGTPLGDPIEVEALKQAFRASGAEPTPRSCALGSVKTNIGHADCAAGIAGLIKTVLCLEHRTLVPSLHFERPHPALELDSSPFFVPTVTAPWERSPRYAGVSSFGIGGTNAHVVLSEAPARPAASEARPWQLFTLSARTSSALAALRSRLRDDLAGRDEGELADVAYSLHVGRRRLDARDAFVVRSREQALDALARDPVTAAPLDRDAAPSVVFMFPGQGAKPDDLGRELYRTEPVFRQHADRCSGELEPLLGVDLAALLYADQTPDPRVRQPALWQPALFLVEFALARLWMSWGIRPQAMIGHSLGEIVAATLAGVLPLGAALRLVARRGRGTAELSGGAMLAVPLPEEELAPWVREPVSLAAVNAASLCVLSGPVEEIERLAVDLARHQPVRLESEHAFHSRAMEPLMDPLAELAATFRLAAPEIPYVSNVTGSWMSAEDATDPAYWARHLRQPVRFHQGLECLLAEPGRVLLEVGPGAVLSRLAQRRGLEAAAAVPSLAAPRPDPAGDGRPSAASTLEALGTLWRHGVEVEWEAFHKSERRWRLALPTYPFEHESFRLDARPGELEPSALRDLDTRSDPADWFYLPVWQQAPLERAGRFDHTLEPGACWLVLLDAGGRAETLIRRLRTLGQTVVTVKAGRRFAASDALTFTIDPASAGDYRALLDVLGPDQQPRRMIHAWGLDPPAELEQLEAALVRQLESLVHLAQVFEPPADGTSMRWTILTEGMQGVTGETSAAPEKGVALGAVRVIPKEFPHLALQSIDVDWGEGEAERQADRVLAEALLETPEHAVAYRRGMRWVPGWRPVPWRQAATAAEAPTGSCLILHAFRALGLPLAEHLLARGVRDLVLVDRHFFPPPEEWETWIAEMGEEDLVSRRIRQVQALVARGARVRVLSADPADLTRMTRLRDELAGDLEPVTGVYLLDGPLRNGLIQGWSPTELRGELDAAVRAPYVLARAFADASEMVFFAVNPAAGAGIGQLASAAAHAFFDRFGPGLTERRNLKPLVIDWGTRRWQEDDEASESLPEPIRQQLDTVRERFGASREECLEALERARELAFPRLVVSTRDYPALLAQQSTFTTRYFQQQLKDDGEGGALHPRPELAVPFVAPRDEVEEMLAEIWRSYLGLREIGVDDNFFELGGHSLLALELLARINDTLEVQIKLESLFNAPTIAELASLLHEEAIGAEDAEEVDRLLAEIEGLSDEEIEAALGARHAPGAEAEVGEETRP